MKNAGAFSAGSYAPKNGKALCLIALLWRLIGIGLSSIAPQIWDCGADRVRKVQHSRADRSRIPHRIRGCRGWVNVTKVAEFRTLLRERLDGFELIAGIIDAEQIDFLSQKRTFHESSNLQCLISKEKMSKDGQRVILLENGRFCFFKNVVLQGFFGSKHGFKSNIHC